MTSTEHTSDDRDDLMDVSACACRALRQASRVVTQIYDQALKPSGLRATQFTILAALELRGDLSISKLAEALVLDRTTLTRNLQPLLDRGLVFSQGDDDGRVRVTGLTGKGRQAFDDALPCWQSAQAQFIRCVGPNQWASLIDDLKRTVDVLQHR